MTDLPLPAFTPVAFDLPIRNLSNTIGPVQWQGFRAHF
jgi:hypothetical protein